MWTVQHCTELNYTKLHCAALHYTALHNTVLNLTDLHSATMHWNVLHFIELSCTTLHRTTLPCREVHWTAMHFILLHLTVQSKFMPQNCTTRSTIQIVWVFLLLLNQTESRWKQAVGGKAGNSCRSWHCSIVAFPGFFINLSQSPEEHFPFLRETLLYLISWVRNGWLSCSWLYCSLLYCSWLQCS